jgi:outer membrane lipoprotein-sorting protein
MKRLILAATGLLVFTLVQAQSLEEIVKKYTVANKLDKIGSYSTIKVTGKMSAMGMEMPMEMWMKNPNKLKTVTSMNGQEMISVFDGEKGYSVNPMQGTTPVEMTPDQVKQTLRGNYFQNYMANYFKDGKLTLEAEESVNGKPCFKIKADMDGGNMMYMFIDKGSYLVQKSSINVNQNGMAVTVDSFPSDYKETNGVLLPMKTTTSTSGMEFVITFDKVEVNLPMDDSIFKVK